jgi:predicted dehydrogenase
MGSIGVRHFKNLIAFLKKKGITWSVDVLKQNAELQEDVRKNVDNIFIKKDDLKSDYDITFIVNPTALHYETMHYMANRTKHMFIEKPIFEKENYDIGELNLNSESTYYVAAPLRFSGILEIIKDILPSVRVFSVRVICSSYLPDWRKDRDYRAIYSASKKLGGGVSIDLIHELDYLVELFGFPETRLNAQGKFSNLEIDSEDLSVYILKYQDKLIELHLDYFGRIPKREIEIFTEKGTIIGDFIGKKVSTSWNNEVIVLDECEDIYTKEMEHFFQIIAGIQKNTNTPLHALRVLQLAEGRI